MKSVAKKRSVILLLMLVFAVVFSAVVLADLNTQQTSILAVYTLFKKDAKAEFSNNIDNPRDFERIYPIAVDKIKAKGVDYYDIPSFQAEITTPALAGKIVVDAHLEGDVFKFIEKKAEQFARDELVEAYKRYVGAPWYDLDTREFLLTTTVLVPKELDDLLGEAGLSLIVHGAHASDRGNARIPFARREVAGTGINYVYEKEMNFDASVEEEITFTIENSFDFGFGLIDATTSNPVDSVRKRFDRNNGPQSINLVLKKRDKPTKKLTINFLYETEKDVTDSLGNVGVRFSDLPPITIEKADTATGPWNAIGLFRGSVIEKELESGKYYRVIYTPTFLQYTLDRIKEDIGELRSSTVTSFRPVYELSRTTHPVEIKQTAGKELAVRLHQDDYTGVDLNDRSSYSLISTSSGQVYNPLESPRVTTEGEWKNILLSVEIPEGSYQLKLENRYLLNTFTFMDRIEKDVEDGQVTYYPPPGNLVRTVGVNIPFSASNTLSSSAVSGVVAGAFFVTKDGREEEMISGLKGTRISSLSVDSTPNSVTITPLEAGEYVVKYRMNRKIDTMETKKLPILGQIPVIGSMIFSYEKGTKSDVNIEEGIWTITVNSDNNVENEFELEISRIKAEAARNYEEARNKREQIEAKTSPADTVAGRDQLKTEANDAINRALQFLETDAFTLILKYKQDKLGENHPKLINEKSLVDQAIRLYKEEKDVIKNIDSADPQIKYDSTWFSNNLDFQPASAKTRSLLNVGAIELRLGAEAKDVWKNSDIKWTYKSKSTTSTALIKEGTNSVFTFTPVANSVVQLEIREKRTGRNEVVYSKSWDVEPSLKPRIVASVVNRAAGEYRAGDKVTFKVLPVTNQLTEREYKDLFENYEWKLKEPRSNKGLKKATTTNTVNFKLKSGEYKIKVILKSTTYPSYNNLESDVFTFNVVNEYTPNGRQDYLAKADENAKAGMELVAAALKSDGTVDKDERTRGKKLIELAIQDYKSVRESYAAFLKVTAKIDPEYLIYEKSIEEVNLTIKRLENFLSDNFNSINGQLFFLKPDVDKYLKGAVVYFSLGRVEPGDDFKWETDKPNAWRIFPGNGAAISARLKDDATLGPVTVTATQYRAGSPLIDAAGKVVQVSMTINVIQAEVSTLDVSPPTINMELSDSHGFIVTTDVPNIIPRSRILAGSVYVKSIVSASGLLTVELKDSASLDAGVAKTGKVEILVYNPSDESVNSKLTINVVGQDTLFEILEKKQELKVSETQVPIQLKVSPTIKRDNLNWVVVNQDGTSIGRVDNNNVMYLDELRVNDEVTVKVQVTPTEVARLGLVEDEDSFSFNVVQDADVSMLTVTPSSVELAVLPVATGFPQIPVRLVAEYNNAAHRVQWAIEEDNPKIKLTVGATEKEALVSSLPDAVTGSKYTVVVTAGSQDERVTVSIVDLRTNVITINGDRVNLKSEANQKTRTTKTTSEVVEYLSAEGIDDKVYLKLDGVWYELPEGRSEELFIDKYYLKKARGI
jgi:hypothetical protein